MFPAIQHNLFVFVSDKKVYPVNNSKAHEVKLVLISEFIFSAHVASKYSKNSIVQNDILVLGTSSFYPLALPVILAPGWGSSFSIEVAIKLADALSVSLDYLVGKTDLNVDKSLLDKLLTIQQLPEEDREHILYSIDGLIQHAKTRMAYKK